MPARHNLVLPVGIEKEIRPWLDYRKSRNFSPLTMESDRRILLQLSAYLWADHRIERLRDTGPTHLAAWQHTLIARMRLMSSVERCLVVSRLFFAWLELTGAIFETPAKGLVLPKYQRPILWVPTEAQISTFLLGINGDGAIDLRDRAFMEIAYASGLRLHELIGMNLDSVDLHYGTVRIVGKGQKERVVPLTRAAIAATRLYLEKARPVLLRDRQDNAALWLSSLKGARASESTMQSQIYRRSKKSNLRMNPHAIRRAFATHLLRGGASVAEIKELLGHTTYRHLGHYLRTAPMELQEAHRKSRLSR